MATLMEKDSLINGISQTLGLIVAQTGGRNEDSELLAGLRNKLYALKPEEIDYEELSKLVSKNFININFRGFMQDDEKLTPEILARREFHIKTP